MNSIFIGKSYDYGDLCARLDINELYEPAFRQQSRRSDVCITLRPVSFSEDEEMVAVCALLEWTNESPSTPEDRVNSEKDVLQSIADSEAGQTFLGIIDDRAAFLTGIHESLQHPISNVYPARKGDYFLTLKMPPYPGEALHDDLSLSILQACLVHYFSFPFVEKIMARIDKKNFFENELYELAGFRFLREMDQTYRLYYHTGAGYLDR